MSTLLDRGLIKILIGDYGAATKTALLEQTVHHRVLEYRRSLGGRMIALDLDGVRKKIPAGELFISRKIDGEFNVLIFQNKEIFMLNPGGTIRVGLPLMAECMNLLSQAAIEQALIVGELYYERDEDTRPRVHDVTRVARKPESEQDLKNLKFAVFDLLELNHKPAGSVYADIFKDINTFCQKGTLIHPVETRTVKETSQIEKIYEQWVQQENAEGIVARSDEAGLFKIKPRHTIDVVVVGFTEGVEERVGLLHDLLVAVIRPEGTFHLLGRVGGGFTTEQRQAILSDLKDCVVESEYHEISSDRVAYQMVSPDWVIEISCLDMISQTTRGGNIDRMVLNWNYKNKSYEIIRHMPLVSILSPQFIRKRDDKTAEYSNVRFAQITDLVEVPKSDKNSLELTFAKSEILKRKVCTKVIKGATMVRKLLLWKTNKENESDEFPAYVLYGTDFSPNRKTPVNRDIRISSSLQQLEELWQQLEKKYFVKGWNPIEE
ncbi:hypothetical protein ACFL27_26150 [candidate division CSSED10-310 bacterium]|uniref:DNA ligase (ATP) n=1 Tax=candidate division CSSED10-310 bacterium TaxID=2855610 RepID=A0ABV6Z5N0_UNCC1